MKTIIFRSFGLGLLLLLTSGICRAQALAPQQKGQLWTVAVHLGWPDYTPTRSWATHEEFYTWLDKQKAPSAKEIRQLKQDVIPFIRKTYKHNDATPVELAKALEILLPDLLSRKNKPLTASGQTALRQQLSAVVKPPVADTIQQSTVTEALPVATRSIAQQADSIPNSTSTTTKMTDKPTSTKMENSSILYGLSGLLLGFGAGFLFGRRNSGSISPNQRTSYIKAAPSQNIDAEVIDWTHRKSQTTALPPTNAWNEQPVSTSKPQRRQAPAETVASQTDLSEPEATETTAGHTVGTEVQLEVSQVASAASTNLYGPAPDTPSIEARKLTPQSFPQMPICLRLVNPQAAVGSFVLNPHAEQSRLIGNGIRELKAFFDFDLPLPDNFSTITTSKPGKMELRNDTWHLVEKAKIELK